MQTYSPLVLLDLVKENPYRYVGYFWDRKTQNYYLQHRYYNPRLGRFISLDPIRGDITNPLSLNRYVYVLNNPVNYVDPNGEFPLLLIWFAVEILIDVAIFFLDLYFIYEISKDVINFVADPNLENGKTLAVDAALTLLGFKLGKMLAQGIRRTALELKLFRNAELLDGASKGFIKGIRSGRISKDIRAWNEFQKGTKEIFASRAEAGQAWKAYKEIFGVKTGRTVIKKTRRGIGEIHHLLSNKIMRAINKHPRLKGIFKRDDPLYMYRALDSEAHKGYQTWHREYDSIVVEWLENNINASEQQFKEFLHDLYQQPWLKERIPNVNLK